MFHRIDVFEVWLFLLVIRRRPDGCCKGLKNRPIPFQQQLVLVTPLCEPDKKQQITSRKIFDICNYFKEVVMNSEEKMRKKMAEEEDEEQPFFKAAFDHFDWNHSSTIPTSVRVDPFTHFWSIKSVWGVINLPFHLKTDSSHNWLLHIMLILNDVIVISTIIVTSHNSASNPEFTLGNAPGWP